MKKIASIIVTLLLTLMATAQNLNITQGSVTYQFPASQTGEMTYGNGNTLTVMGKTFTLSDITMVVSAASSGIIDPIVYVAYNGTSATVTVPGQLAQYLTVSTSGAHVSIVQSSDVSDTTCGEITYNLSGTSTDGEFYLDGSYKATVELNGLTLTNTSMTYSGAPVYINNGKRIDLSVKKGTENTLKDTSASTAKGCLYCKGHLELKGQGTLNIYAYGSAAHGIKTGDYYEMKNCTVNILSATKDGLNCNEYFLIESGTLNISGTGDDGIQASLDGTTSTGITTDHEDEDTGNIYIEGGTININTGTVIAAKGIKADGDIFVTDGTIDVITAGKGEWDSDDQETSACAGMSADGNITINGGTITLTSTGSGGKGMKCDGLLIITDGTVTATTSGGLYYNNGSSENTNYTGDTDRVDSKYYSSPKAIKAGTKTQSGNSYTYSGGIVISGGVVTVKTSGNNGEGIESKNTFEITGGTVIAEANDDALNAAQDFTISGGTVLAVASNNDAMDANGNIYIKGGTVYAISLAGSPEVAIDANSEEQKKLYFTGGNLVAIGGLENGSSLSQTCYQASSWSGNTWYGLYNGSTLVFAFKTPSSSRLNSTMVVSSASTKLYNLTVSGGAPILNGYANTGGSYTQGSAVTLSNYTGGNAGGGPGGPFGPGRPGGW